MHSVTNRYSKVSSRITFPSFLFRLGKCRDPDRDHAVAMLTFFMKLGLFYRGEREYMVRKKKIKRGDESDSESETEEQKKER